MTEFKVGDRVRCISKHDSDLFNKVGTVKVLDSVSPSVGVEFDDEIHGHACDGSCKDGHGWWLAPKDLVKIGSQDKIIIYAQDSTVTAKLISNKACVAQAVAKCSPDDNFDVLVGAQIALQRLVEQQGSKFVLNTKAFKDIELL